MTKKQADAEFLKLCDQHIKEEDEIMRKAKAEGRWMSGLDANRALFAELNKKFYEKVQLLASMIDEDETEDS